MPLIIEDMQVEVLPPAQGAAGEAATVQPAEGAEFRQTLELLELARERAERLACD